MDRKRYKEIANIADEVVALMVQKGITANEGCLMRRIAEAQWEATVQYPNPQSQQCDPQIPQIGDSTITTSY